MSKRTYEELEAHAERLHGLLHESNGLLEIAVTIVEKEVLPQAGGMVVDVGRINDFLLGSKAALAESHHETG